MVNNPDEFLMLSGIQHFHFCKRQWALIHIEQQWEENVKTIEGQHLHEKVNQPILREKRGERLIVRALPVQSTQLKISGICDVVEFIRDDHGVPIHNADGLYKAYPIEYKRGHPKKDQEDILQLAAQAICLEEMLLCEIDIGYIYYHEIKHRIEVHFTYEIKQAVKDTILEMQDYYKRKHTPKVKTGAFCKSCSLNDICLPQLMNKRSVRSYMEGMLQE